MKATREVIPVQESASYAYFEFIKPEFDHPYHFHPEIEITEIIESDGQRLIGDSLEPFEAGDLAIIGSGLPHIYTNWQRGHSRSRVIQFLPDVLKEQFLSLPEFQSIRLLFERANRGLLFPPETRKKASTIIQQIHRSHPGPESFIRLLDLLNILSQSSNARPIAGRGYAKPLSDQTADRLQRVLAYIDLHWNERLTLAQVAKVAALHPQSLSRFFHKHLGTSFQSYLVRIRLNRAARSLIESDKSVTEIAFESGFENMANFNRQFKKCYDCPPRTFRSIRRPLT